MSTYNGEKYLREQIDSILDQRGIGNMLLLIHDDGSTDRTVSIIREYEKKTPSVHLLDGKHIGYPKCFEHLWRNSPKAEFYAFSDQDDVWLPEKLSRAITQLRQRSQDERLLYCAQREIVGPDLEPLGVEEVKPQKGIMINFLFPNAAGGSAMVFNENMRQFLCKGHLENGQYHDSWIYKLTDLCGTFIYDEHKVILYRQHGEQTVGYAPDFFGRLTRLGRRILSGQKKRKMDATYQEVIVKDYREDLSEEQLQLLETMVRAKNSWSARWKLLNTPGIPLWPVPDYLFRKLRILLGRV